ncbi:LuxR family transcriptional regulator [Romeria aff. gracilis LEGE 07310]|uniref:LuxR family transcriptional regulator n=1 Tax=Vasconcelosia minhoensis LEGE 07310 TaxID=915328 RepID=A0A8J7DRQ9_9CYAN|nr:LuxR C-terminal-related transcriptional regulator [Romeria gracilis]MBE9079099.1 LuxR family transcriptional regulator [Romeria aff. gracilis LEGE 07310]
MASPLLVTKFHLQSRRSPVVKRDRLFQQLNQGLTSRLILISAAAGFGKTTVLSEWVQQTQLPVSWLALDQRDNDSTRFWTYIVAALQQTDRAVGEATLSILQSSEAGSFEAFLPPLLNELAQLQTDLILSLDDYHLITAPEIHAALAFFLDYLPAQVHLAIATRTDPPLPLARLRARAQLTELRAADLRFTDEEAAEFLQQSLSQPLTAPQVEALQKQTEGWIAGLQLAMLSLRDTAQSEALIDSFRGNQRYVLDYLIEEVLDRQPPALQTFLLRTSVLEQMCGSLCEAVVGEETVNGVEVLEQLEHQNLFVVPLDRDRTWYRYHHLFAESLRHLLQRTDPDYMLACHHRAAQWYEHQGYIADALDHVIAAGSFEDAASLIEQEMQTHENPRLDAIVLRSALAAMPPKLTHSRPWLLAAQAWVGFTSSRFAEAISVIHILEELLDQNLPAAENSDQLWGLVVALKGMKARQQGHVAESVAFMEKALQLLPQDYSWLRSLILLNLGVTYFVADNYEAAKQLLPEVSRIGKARGTADPAIAGLYLQAQFLALRGRMDAATSLCQQGLNLATERHWLATYAGVLVEVALADLLREQNQLEAAAQHLTQSIDRAIQNQQPGLMMGYITLARVRQAQGDFQAAWAAIQAAERCQPWLWSTILSVATCKARLQLAEGHLDGAIAWVEKSGLSVEGELHYSPTEQYPAAAELDYLTYARVLLAQARLQSSSSHLQDALRLLNRLYEFAKTGGRTIRVMEVLLLQALAFHLEENQKQALDALNHALNVPREGKYFRLFLDEGNPMAELLKFAASKNIYSQEVNYLLAELSSVKEDKSASAQPLIEPLTDRELEVLHYLATGMTNQAIADRLFVSLAAVKWHARNIYGKLAVNNRTQAVARARESRILN